MVDLRKELYYKYKAEQAKDTMNNIAVDSETGMMITQPMNSTKPISKEEAKDKYRRTLAARMTRLVNRKFADEIISKNTPICNKME